MTDRAAGGQEARLVLLGTGGGPIPSPVRHGIAQAVVVGGRVYLVDCGSDVTRQLRRARLLRDLDTVFLTHLHSDHDCDLFNLFLLGWPILQQGAPVRVHGPGSAGGLPTEPAETAARERPTPVVSPALPAPGLAALVALQLQAHAYDVNVRMRESGRRDIRELVVPVEIGIPDVGASAEVVAPAMAPFTVHEDDRVRVSAILVEHGVVFPSFAFRFDTDVASVVVSGDTVPCPNLVRLAAGADTLVHEVYDDSAASPFAGDPSRGARLSERHVRTSHTPLSAVGRIAAEAGAQRLVLTHFIVGDDVLPDRRWLDGVRDFRGEVVVGADLMELSL